MALSIINRSVEQGAEDLRDWLPLKTRHPVIPEAKRKEATKGWPGGIKEGLWFIDSEWRGH